MQKQKKQIIVLAVLLILCVGAYIGIRMYNAKTQESKKKETEAKTTHVAKIAEKDITAFSYDYNGSTLSFTKANDKWTYDKDSSVNLDQSSIKTMLANLSDVKATDKIKKYDDTATYGFDSPTLALNVTTKEKTYALKFGITNSMLSSTYMMLDSDTTVYLADTTLETAFEKSIDELTAKATSTETSTSAAGSNLTTEASGK